MIIPTFLALALSASAIDQANTADARCLAWFLMLESKPDQYWPDQYWDAAFAKSAALYYAGRISGRDPAADLQAVILRAAPMARRLSPAERAQCRGALKPVGVALHGAADLINSR
ncbi:hypothetical protein QH494_26020 [Sphingomonas sp. AR_OL41]|uniref:hypothetical protein n=1 Tax=Sphingomonas sp. AR_OL41 TaxID=3042729 RepID=UPI00248180F9|nr:hypothetical protein [Sphingomonas sp. AR_OL41]MDH7975657.1 hypothetical protein [Sphingomonas sp. AR_OL41]